MFNIFDKAKTFKPKKPHPKGSKRYELHKHAKATLGNGQNLKKAVELPDKEDLNEWLAVNTVDFFNQINLLYGGIQEFCTAESCPIMGAGPQYEYLWADEETKKPVQVTAQQYIDKLMNWIQQLLDDESIFPSKTDTPFPKTFANVIKQVFKRLFRVYAHIYYSHFQRVCSLGQEPYLNTCFKHFYYFVIEFNLIEPREMVPLQELINNLIEKKLKKKILPKIFLFL